MKLYGKAILILLVVVIAFVLLVHNEEKGSFWETLTQQKRTTEKQETSLVTLTRVDGTVLKLSMQAYLEGVVGSEMPASFEMEALKAQSVAARTFVMKRGMEVDDTTRTQVYHDDQQLHKIWGTDYEKYHNKVKEAIASTANEVLTYKGSLISAVFFSSSCGKTANSQEYWESTTPYLQSVDSSQDLQVEGNKTSVEFSNEEFHTLLGFENEVSELGEPVYYDSGYVKNITIDKITFSGRKIRELLNLRSSCFTIQKNSASYVVTTKGYGHGIGMSQHGAQAMALEGVDYQSILKHYYSGVKIEKKDV